MKNLTATFGAACWARFPSAQKEMNATADLIVDRLEAPRPTGTAQPGTTLAFVML